MSKKTNKTVNENTSYFGFGNLFLSSMMFFKSAEKAKRDFFDTVQSTIDFTCWH
jgi:hypothetical protein